MPPRRRHGLRCLRCKGFIRAGGPPNCQRCIDRNCAETAAIIASRTAAPLERDCRRHGYLTRRPGMSTFVPEYHTYGRRFTLLVLAIFTAMLACR